MTFKVTGGREGFSPHRHYLFPTSLSSRAKFQRPNVPSRFGSQRDSRRGISRAKDNDLAATPHVVYPAVAPPWTTWKSSHLFWVFYPESDIFSSSYTIVKDMLYTPLVGRESRCHVHGRERPGGLKQEGRLDGGPPPVGVVVPGLSRIPFKAHGKLADIHPIVRGGDPSRPNHAPPQPRSAWDGIQSLTFGSIAIGGARKALAKIYTGNCGFGKGYPEIVPSGSPCASGREIPVPCRKWCWEVVPNSELGWCRMLSNMRVLREKFNFHDNWSRGIQFKLPRPLFMTSSGVTSLWRHFLLHRSKCSGRNLFRSCDFWPCVDTLTLSPPSSESDALEGIRLTGTELYFRKAKRQLQLQRLGIQLNLGLLTQG